MIARREGLASWTKEATSVAAATATATVKVSTTSSTSDQQKIERLTWIYPIQGVSVINVLDKATPFVFECMVRKRMEKRIEVVLSGLTRYKDFLDSVGLRVRSATPFTRRLTSSAGNKQTTTATATKPLGEFTHTLKFANAQLQELAKNSIAMKLLRVEREADTDLIVLVFDFIFCPSKSFM